MSSAVMNYVEDAEQPISRTHQYRKVTFVSSRVVCFVLVMADEPSPPPTAKWSHRMLKC